MILMMIRKFIFKIIRRSLVKSEKVIVEGGRKKKLIKITKIMEDGSTQVEIEKEAID